MITTVRRRAAILAVAIVIAAGSASLMAQSAPPSFSWFAELVSVDATKKTVMVKAPVEAHLGRSVRHLEAGTPIVVIWTQFDAEADAVRYVDRADRVPADLSGYVVRATYIGSDASGLTFAAVVPDRFLQTLGAATAGTSVKVTSAMRGAVSAVTLGERPKPRPVVKAAATGPVGPPPVNVAGLWSVKTTLMGNKLELNCQLTQDNADLAGTCIGPGPLGEMTLTAGGVKGTDVAFQFDITGFGPKLVFSLKGTADSSLAALTGMVSVSGFDAPFTAAKR